MLLDAKSKPVGYGKRVPALIRCHGTAKAFRQREKITPDMIWDLVLRKMGNRLAFIHSCHILVVDYNEMNFAAAPDFSGDQHFDVDETSDAIFPTVGAADGVVRDHSHESSIKGQIGSRSV